MATAGDVNGDGYDDLVVGAWYDDEGANNAGAAYLILGTAAPTGGSLSSAVKYVGKNEGEGAGRTVSSAGDTNGDGYADVLVGAYTNQDVATYAGAAVLILGGPAPGSAPVYDGVVFSGEEVMNFAGVSLSPAGDVNGDTLDDVIIGAYGKSDYAGAAYVILGSSSPVASSLSTAITFEGESSSNLAGWAVTGGEDADGDGFDDILVGATSARDAAGAATGSAYLVLGSGGLASANLSTAVKYTGEADGHHAGCAVAASGDVDGDGYGDFLVGADGNSDGGSNAGAAYVLLGTSAPASTALASTIQFTGEALDDEAGGAVSGAGDVDGDGHDDMLVSASENDTAGSRAGAVYLVFGANSLAPVSLSTASRFTGENPTDYAGIDAAGAGDVNADGYADFLIGAYLNDAAASDAGAAYLILGTGL